MKKIITLIAVLAFVFVLAACNDSQAPLIAPDIDDTYVPVAVEDEDCNAANGSVSDEVYDDMYFDDEDMWEAPDWDAMPTFGSWSGTVTSIDEPNGEIEGMNLGFISLEGEFGNATFVTDFNTFVLGDALAVGDYITGFYLMNMPMAMIYPPQYNVSVIVNGDFTNVAVCRFDENLINTDNTLQLNISNETEIILQSGESMLIEDLANRKLVVVYDISTRSIPAMTTPSLVVVLYEMFMTLPDYVDGWDGGFDDSWEGGLLLSPDVVINGEGLYGVFARFIDDDSIFPTHIPLTAVANHLGAEVAINNTNEISLVGLNGHVVFTVGSADFTVDGETVTLAQPSVDIDGDVYVPFRFFVDVFGMGSAYSSGGQIFISHDALDME